MGRGPEEFPVVIVRGNGWSSILLHLLAWRFLVSFRSEHRHFEKERTLHAGKSPGVPSGLYVLRLTLDTVSADNSDPCSLPYVLECCQARFW